MPGAYRATAIPIDPDEVRSADIQGSEPNEAFCHARQLLLGMEGRQTLTKKGVGTLHMAEM